MLSKQYLGNKTIIFYGKVYDQEKIAKISRQCFIGCYPGQAGLSIVHYMSLSLPPLVCADLTSHMGPEPSYIKNGINGFFFDEYSEESIADKINEVIMIKKNATYQNIGKAAYNTYLCLNTPDLADKLSIEFNKALCDES